ncbi:MAG: VCBS repeat-containing protein [Planctomycetes bacterium]|nr:VCBS repeat-containing protein [Planctomycetota bacterium]
MAQDTQRIYGFRNLGNGEFEQGQVYATKGSAYRLTIADANEDGFPDVLTVLFETNLRWGRVSLLLNLGDGQLDDPMELFSEATTTYVQMADVNGDGHPDLLESLASSNEIAVILKKPESLASDCDGNGIPDSCEPDCDKNGRPDVCEIRSGAENDFSYS